MDALRASNGSSFIDLINSHAGLWSSSFHNIIFSNVKIQQQQQSVEHHFFLSNGHSSKTRVIWLERVDLNFLKEKRFQDSIVLSCKKKLVSLPSLLIGGVLYVHVGAQELKAKSAVAAKLWQSCCKQFSTCRSSCLCIGSAVSIQIENAKNYDKSTLFLCRRGK